MGKLGQMACPKVLLFLYPHLVSANSLTTAWIILPLPQPTSASFQTLVFLSLSRSTQCIAMGPIYSSPTELGPEIKEIQNIATGETSEALLSLFELHHLHHFHHLFHPFLSISSTSIHVHLPSSIFIHFYSCSSISSIYPLLSIFIHFNRPSSIWPCVSTFIYLSPQSSILIYFINSYPFSSILIHRHPFASTFTFTFFLHKSPVLLLRNLQLNLKV